MARRKEHAKELNPERYSEAHDKDRNPDPITGSPGAHPVGTGVGAAGAAAAGAAVGAAAGGPIGAAIGGTVGAVAGGLAGKGVAEAVNPTEEEEYWREEYVNRPYIQPGTTFVEYEPAYRHGYSAYTRYPGRTFDEIEDDLHHDWERQRGTSGMEWERARPAARDAWQRVKDRVERAVPGDSDRDGK